jgi:hypothetical protein
MYCDGSKEGGHMIQGESQKQKPGTMGGGRTGVGGRKAAITGRT